MPISQSSARRVKDFIDCFVRSEYMSDWSAERDTDFINEPDRASRCWDAAESGSDGRTHSEAIDDMRDAFRAWVRDRRMWTEPERFIAAVEDHWDSLEQWHLKNGSLDSQIG